MTKYMLKKAIIGSAIGTEFEYTQEEWKKVTLTKWTSLWNILDLIKAIWIKNTGYFQKLKDIKTRWEQTGWYKTPNWEFTSWLEFHKTCWTLFKNNEQMQTWKFLRNHILSMEMKYWLPDRENHFNFNVNLFEQNNKTIWFWPSSWWGRPKALKNNLRDLWENFYSRYFTWWIWHTNMNSKDIDDRIKYLKAYEKTLQNLLYNDD